MKTLILIRHAHRDKLVNESDNGLSPRGQKQARALRKFFKRRCAGAEIELLSSPKRRCLETLKPIAENKSREILSIPALDEGGDLDAKIGEFTDIFRHSVAPVVVACSHGDWIPRALELWVGASIDVNKGAWVELDWLGRSFTLRWLVQELKSVRK